ncbi:MAG: AAA family ATPase [Clostridia bacterium]|nr:AAA family ATPase [Clostridia bacterium]
MRDADRKRICVEPKSFVEALDYFYVDKTLLIKDVIDKTDCVDMITRPRGFGKSLGLDMLKTFFEKTDEDTSVYFKDKKIWSCGNRYRSRQGKYPVIFLSFGEIKAKDLYGIWAGIKKIISAEFKRHSEILEDTSLDLEDLEEFRRIAKGQGSGSLYVRSIVLLARMLFEHYLVSPVILIDDYNTPAQNACMTEDYFKVTSIIEAMISLCTGDCGQFTYVVMADTLPLLHGTDTPDTFNINERFFLSDRKFETDFGFTSDEVKGLLAYYGAEDNFEEARRMYGGYQIWNTRLFNPKSVLSYVQAGCRPCIYRENGHSAALGNIIRGCTADVAGKLALMEKGHIVPVEASKVTGLYKLPERSNVLLLLRYSGYLTSLGRNNEHIGVQDYPLNYNVDYLMRPFCHDFKIPNNEAHESLAAACENLCPLSEESFRRIWNEIETWDGQKISQAISSALEEISGPDNPDPVMFNEFIACLCRYMSEEYVIDIEYEFAVRDLNLAMSPLDRNSPGIIFRITYYNLQNDTAGASVTQAAEDALGRAILNGYDILMNESWPDDTVKIGIAYSGTEAKAFVAFSHQCRFDGNDTKMAHRAIV